MALQQSTRQIGIELADAVDQAAVLELAVRQEAPVSDAPLAAPQATPPVLLLLA